MPRPRAESWAALLSVCTTKGIIVFFALGAWMRHRGLRKAQKELRDLEELLGDD